MGYSSLLAQLLPPVSYNPSGKNMTVSLGMEGKALDAAFESNTIVSLALDPFKDHNLIKHWEKIYALSEYYPLDTLTYQERIQLLVIAMQESTSPSCERYIRLGRSLGYTIAIKEYKVLKAGAGKAGDPVVGGSWLYTFKVETQGNVQQHFRAGHFKAGEKISSWGNEFFEHVMSRYKPAHTHILFSYIQ